MIRKKTTLLWVVTLIPCLTLGIIYFCSGLIYTRIQPVYRTLSGYGVSRRVSNYEVKQVENFSIRYKASNIDNLSHLENAIKEYGQQVFEFFDYSPKKSIEVILFNDEKEFHRSLGIPEDQPTIGAYLGGKIAILDQGLEQNQGETHEDMIINTFVHELTHLILDELARGNFPLWFTEGSALYMEYRVLGYEWGQDLRAKEIYSMDELTHKFHNLDEYGAYRQAFVYVREFIEEYGREDFLLVLRNLEEGKDFSSEFIKF